MRLNAILLAVAAFGASCRAQTCTDYLVPVSVTHTTPQDFSGQPYSGEVLYAFARREILVTGSYNMSVRLCTPARARSKAADDTIQVLVHGATFNKVMWDIQYEPETYNWVQRMNGQGYATLAVDLVGAGNSTSPFPDGLLEVHTQTFVETMHQVVQKLRAGEIGEKKWEKVVFIGFSIGAVVANSIALQYSEDVDAIMLHGISWDASWLYPAFLAGLQVSANLIDPVKWKHVPSLYQTQSTIEGRRSACFAGKYDEEALQVDWKTRDFDSLGAAITLTYHLKTSPEFRGPVFLGIGDQDSTFCGGRYCRQQPYQIYEIFPNAAIHSINVYPDTGHLIIYHHSAPQLMNDTLRFLRANGF
ncbi:Alpha/Beta hydrolase protein [Bombardia bombarda]|uniref:Alpha/Beta hydrolase protein n=1 Tax=Bombardia bombarda TaxID=252184 RepID=A0AA39WH46_9PEZI|nr:Alpha/Beta hydrolase protein [Bombardia bombarda]